MSGLRKCCVAFVTILLVAGRPTAGEGAQHSATHVKKDAKPKEPTQIVEETVDRVIKILAEPAYESKKKVMRAKVRRILLEQVDMRTVAILTLANYRRKFSASQFKRFVDIFSRLLFTTYISHLEKYTDEKVVVVGVSRSTPTRRMVKTKTITDTKDIPVDFCFLKIGKTWKLYDVHIEGVSLVKNYRSQFREILMKSPAEKLLERLEKKVSANEEKQ